ASTNCSSCRRSLLRGPFTMSDRLDSPTVSRIVRHRRTRRVAVTLVLALAALLACRPATAADQVHFSSTTNVPHITVHHINNANLRLDVSYWYLSEHSISIAIANRFHAGVNVRIIGDRGSIFEADPHTKAEYYWLASQGVPIRLRVNPNYFPEIIHWKS